VLLLNRMIDVKILRTGVLIFRATVRWMVEAEGSEVRAGISTRLPRPNLPVLS
jgi:hypothetical protein